MVKILGERQRKPAAAGKEGKEMFYLTTYSIPFIYGCMHPTYGEGPQMYYFVCGMVHIKEPLMLIGKSSPCGGSEFALLLSDRSFTIYV